MSFKTLKNSININDSIDISFYDIGEDIGEDKNKDSFILSYPEFKNLTIKSIFLSKQKVVELLDNNFNPKIFKSIVKNTILNDITHQYVVETIVYNKNLCLFIFFYGFYRYCFLI